MVWYTRPQIVRSGRHCAERPSILPLKSIRDSGIWMLANDRLLLTLRMHLKNNLPSAWSLRANSACSTGGSSRILGILETSKLPQHM